MLAEEAKITIDYYEPPVEQSAGFDVMRFDFFVFIYLSDV